MRPVANRTLATAVFALAVLVRLLPWRRVMTPDGIVFTDGDSYAHIWRIWMSASQDFPLSGRNPFANFPRGGEIPWPPLFDWGVASAVQVLSLDQQSTELLGAWVPVLLGSAGIAIASLIASRCFSNSAGWVTGVTLAVLPGSFAYTQFGYLDHHAAMTLIGTSMLGGAMMVVSSEDAGPRWWPEFASAICGVALLTWAGALLHIAILQCALVCWAFGAASRQIAKRRTLRLARAHVTTALLILPFSLYRWEIYGDFNPLVLSQFQPTWYVAVSACLALSVLAWSYLTLGSTILKRWLSALLVGGIGFVLALSFVPELRNILEGSAGWFTGGHQFLANITEIAPLLGTGDTFDWSRAKTHLSFLFFLVPLAMVLVGKSPRRPDRWLLILWSIAFGSMTLNQFRFINTYSVAHAIVLGGAMSMLIDWIASNLKRLMFQRVAVVSAYIVYGACIALPAVTFYQDVIRNDQRWHHDFRLHGIVRAADWLRTVQPAPLDAQGMPTASVMCAWGPGHRVRYHSGWPVNQDGFGPYVSPQNVEVAESYFSAVDENDAIKSLRGVGARYVIADKSGAGDPPYATRTMTNRLVSMNGSGHLIRVQGENKNVWLPALTRHRLVYQTPTFGEGVWVYERVRGAVIRGMASPGAMVAVELEVQTPTAGLLQWKSRVRADARGKFRARVPYATDNVGSPRGTRSIPVFATGPYSLRSGDQLAHVRVQEESVQRGGEIESPALDAPKAH